MELCFQHAKAAGRAVRWGDTGPRLMTRLLDETGGTARALPASICYPIHHTEVVDMFRPSATAALQSRIAPATFLHLWNEMFNQNAIQKSMQPPRGSLLRLLAERHRTEGWAAEYDLATLEHIVALRAQLERGLEEQGRLHAQTNEQHAKIGVLQAELTSALAEKGALQVQVAAAAENGSLRSDLTAARARNACLEAEFDAVLRSKSWRMTGPMRSLVTWLRRARTRGTPTC